MPGKKLHILQEKLLSALKINANEPLTIRELQDLFDVSSTSVIAHHLNQLEKKGYLKRNPYNSKDYIILKDSPENIVTYINLYGLAACGPNGSFVNDDPIDRIPVASRLISFAVEDAFMVKAKGKSMEPRIFEGDLVIARKIDWIDTGGVYVCINDGEALIKRVEEDNRNIILHSFNLNFKPFTASDDFKVVGEVKGIISRKF